MVPKYERSRFWSTTARPLAWNGAASAKAISARLRLEAVADAANGDEVARLGRIFFELRAELEHEVVDGAQGDVVAGAPHALEQLLAREGAVVRFDQAPEHVEFGGRELDERAVAPHLARARIHLEIGGAERLLAASLDDAVTAEHGFDASE